MVRVGAVRRLHPVVAAGVALLLLQLVLRGVLASSSWFFQDDFYLAAQASRGLTAGFLLQDYSGHLMPLGLLLVWATTAIAPLTWGPPLAVMLAMQLATGLVLLRTLLLVVGRRAVALVPLALFVLTPLTFNSLLWWANGLQAMPNLLALVVAVDGHLRYLRWGRRRHAVQSLLAVAVGLAFYEKVLLVPLLLALLTVLPLARERGWGRLSAPWERRWYWGAHVLLATAYAGLYLARTGGVGGAPSPPGDWPAVLGTAGRSVAVALAGGPWRAEGAMPVAAHVAPPEAVVAVVVAGIGALVAWTVARGGRRAVDAWLVLTAYVLLDVALLIAGRGELAPFLARDPRYYADAAPVAALALALALRAALEGERRPVLSRRTAVVFSLASAAVVVGSVQSTVVLGSLAGRNDARGYVDAMRSALRADPDVALADSPAAPTAIVEAFLGGDASVQRVLEPLPEGDRLRTAGARLRVFDRRGRLVEGVLLGRLHAPPGEDGDCGYEVKNGWLTVPLGSSGRSYDGHVKVAYVTGTARLGGIDVAGRRHPVIWHAGVHEWWVPVDGEIDDVLISAVQEEDALCITDVEAGRMWPPLE